MTDDIESLLADFGLSDKEVDAYLAVVREGDATMREVAEAADVSQGYVYDIATRLADRGLVTVDDTVSPAVVRARPPAEATDVLADRLQAFEGKLDELYRQPEHSPDFEAIHSRQTFQRRVRTHLDAAEREAFVALPGSTVASIRDALADAVDRGVFVYLLVIPPEMDAVLDDRVTEFAHVVRTWDERPPVTVVTDSVHGVSALPNMLFGRYDDQYALSFNHVRLASTFVGEFLGNYWRMATERYVAEPDPLPTAYETVRTGVTMAMLHERAGQDLVVEATVTEPGADERRRIGGDVVEVRQGLVGEPTNEFPLENSLVVDTGDERVSIAGAPEEVDPFLEDYAAVELRLREA